MKIQNFRFTVHRKFPKIPGNTKLFPGIFGTEIFREFPGIPGNVRVFKTCLVTNLATLTLTKLLRISKNAYDGVAIPKRFLPVFLEYSMTKYYFNTGYFEDTNLQILPSIQF